MNFLRSTSGEVVRPSSCQFLFRFETCTTTRRLQFDRQLGSFLTVWEPPETDKDITKISSTQREVEAEPASNDTAIHSLWKRLIATTIRSFGYKLAAWPPR
uniref:(northern house mosquito) hypothetical protein n=1 Tax=Culex pipiens TaxID=7175 RepID=A0A8D8PHW7_CULPI